MAAGTFTQEDAFRLELYEGDFNFATDTYVGILVTAAKTPAPATDKTYADVSADEEATGNGYTVGGEVITITAPSESGGVVTITSSAPTWASYSGSARYLYILKRAGASLASTDLIVGHVDLDTALAAGVNLVGQGGALTVTPSASGWISDTHTP
jgi:hypothetical protein